MKKEKIIVILLCLIVIVSVSFITYAFYMAISEDSSMEVITVDAGTSSLSFYDNGDGFGGTLNFGESKETSFIIENTGDADAYAKLLWKNIVNTYLDGSLVFTLKYSESENGTYNILLENENVPRSEEAQNITIVDGLAIPKGAKYYYKLILTLVNSETVDQTEDLTANFMTEFTLEAGTSKLSTKSGQTLASLNLTSKLGKPDFSTVATTDETADGLYELADDYGISYYFRGATENNYVYFAGLYWRIIRINGDGSLRLIYDGTSAYANGTSNAARLVSTSIQYNVYTGDNAYAGYMYGLAGTTTDADRCLKLNNNTGAVDDLNSIYTVNKEGCESIGGIWTTTAYEATHANVKNSTIKDTLESWYQTYIEDAGYSDYVSDELFCNDREVQTDLNANGGYPASIGVSTLGYGAYLDIYMSFYRVGYKVDNPKPQFKCTQKNDAFTVSDSKKGNASLSKPIGLITLDEVSAAGGKYYSDTNIYSNYNYYLYKGYAYWSMVPLSNEKNKTIYNTMGFITNTGGFFAVSNTSQIGLAPVINLSFKTANSLIGTGIIGDEYRLPSE